MSEFVKIAKISEVSPGTAKFVEVQSNQIALFNIEGNFYAIGNTCTHRGGPLAEGSINGDEVTCPWHGSKFKISTGEVVGPPATKSVPRYNLRVQGDDIEIELEASKAMVDRG
jgi:3-phenylpropionate/trans-cinnamate dioxygenase ferredoxin component